MTASQMPSTTMAARRRMRRQRGARAGGGAAGAGAVPSASPVAVSLVGLLIGLSVPRPARFLRMRAVVVREPGGPEVLEVADVPDPVAGPGEVVVEVAAAGVNRADLLQRQGHYPPPPGAPVWPGLECSGWIAQVGDGVEGWVVGDAVCALLSGGGYAERVAVPAGQLLPVPAGVGLVEAAALPEVACTVWSNVFMLAGLRPGETLLVHGGSSGIGTMAIQLARHVGARVAVTAGSAAKLEACERLGARGPRELPRAGLRRRGEGGDGTGTAPTSSSTTWARSTWPATSTCSRPAAGSSSSGCRAARRRS